MDSFPFFLSYVSMLIRPPRCHFLNIVYCTTRVGDFSCCSFFCVVGLAALLIGIFDLGLQLLGAEGVPGSFEDNHFSVTRSKVHVFVVAVRLSCFRCILSVSCSAHGRLARARLARACRRRRRPLRGRVLVGTEVARLALRIFAVFPFSSYHFVLHVAFAGCLVGACLRPLTGGQPENAVDSDRRRTYVSSACRLRRRKNRRIIVDCHFVA